MFSETETKGMNFVQSEWKHLQLCELNLGTEQMWGELM